MNMIVVLSTYKVSTFKQLIHFNAN